MRVNRSLKRVLAAVLVFGAIATLGQTVVKIPNGSVQKKVMLAWDANPPDDPVDGYRLRYGPESGSHTTVIDVGNVTTYTIEVPSGARTFFTVTAYNDTLESDPSNEVSARRPGARALTIHAVP